ncbi:MAG: acyl-CoA thioesterase [Muribaculaceae bacterium]|nr:acyl-CoA thioesterase [Muribaculaceae bacterium]
MSSNPRIPAPFKEFRHRLPVQLRFNDVDMFGHVNNTVYLQFFDLGKLRYFEDVLGADFDKSGLAVVVVNINCDFFEPSFLNEELEVLTRTVHIGEKSITIEQRILKRTTGAIKCRCQTVMAGFDPKTLQSAPIPEHHRQTIDQYESPLY